ncbi:MAG: hypothetical protein E7260_10960 [Lachnospiraceae bacterium]|nr:hypothetical protein [Lachnospiraceae bacterium]
MSSRKHEVNVVLTQKNFRKRQVLSTRKVNVREFFLRKLFGEARQILVLNPGETVETVKIIEVKGEETDGRRFGY